MENAKLPPLGSPRPQAPSELIGWSRNDISFLLFCFNPSESLIVEAFCNHPGPSDPQSPVRLHSQLVLCYS